MAAKRRKVTTESTLSEETEDCQQLVPWNELSPYVLEKIYSRLCRKDQVNMSVVCRGWSEGYGMPSVWRKFVFSLNESKLSTSGRLYMKFAEKYSKHFRRVRIYCNSLSKRHMYSIWSRRFIYFLEILIRNSKLESVEFLYLGLCLCSENANNTKLYEAIAEFLKSQQGLRMVRFVISLFAYNEGNELLKILAETHGKSLECLTVQNYFRCDLRSENFLDGLQEFPRILAFPKLITLETDNSFVLEYLLACHSNEIERFKKNETHVLSKVKLRYTGIQDDRIAISQGLTSDHWKILTTMFPNLQVEIFLRGKESIIVNMTSFIKPNMPITKLMLHFIHHKNKTELGTIFDCLRECETNDYLEIFVFQCFCTRIVDFKSFLSFIEICTKLKYLLLRIMDPINAITLIESLKDNRSETLKYVFIKVDEHMKNKPDYPKFKKTFNTIRPKVKFNVMLVDSSYI